MRAKNSLRLFFFLSVSFFCSFSLQATSEVLVAFNHDDQKTYFERYRGIEREGSDFEAIILESIEAARENIDLAVHEIRLASIAKALARKHQEGVQVRVILENQYHQTLQEILDAYKQGDLTEAEFQRFTDYFQLTDLNQDQKIDPSEAMEGDAVYILRSAGIPLRDDTADNSKGSGLMHHKFMVIDGKSVLVTSANFTLSDIHGDLNSLETRGNWNALIRLSSEPLAKSFHEEFIIMFGHSGDIIFPESPPRFGVKKPYRRPQFHGLDGFGKVAVQFSPVSTNLPWEHSTNGVIARVISQARKSIHGALFVFSDQNLAYALEDLNSERKIDISFVIDSRFAFQYYSEGLDLLGLQMLGQKCEYEEGNSPWSKPIQKIGRAAIPSGDLFHHKFAVVDDRFVLFGSHNWSESANDINDENLLILDSSAVAKKFAEELVRIHKRTYWGAPDSVLERIYEKERDCF